MALGLILATAALGASCGSGSSSAARATTSISPSAPLSAPKASAAQDGQYLSDIAEADPALVTYVQTNGDVALHALLTDGSAFCAFLQRGMGIDDAMASVVIGANSVETQTHLPASVTTFNTIDAAALLTLCPSDQSLVPVSVRNRLGALESALASHSG